MKQNKAEAEIMKEFDEKVNELRSDLGTGKEYLFGYKLQRGDELFTIVDWGNIKNFILQKTLPKKMVVDILEDIHQEVKGVATMWCWKRVSNKIQAEIAKLKQKD